MLQQKLNSVSIDRQIIKTNSMFKKDQGKQIVQEHIESQNLIKRYIKGNLLGKGGFAKCYEFISQETSRKYAAKIIQKSSLTKPKAKQKLQSEIKIHKSLHHHNIVNFQHFFEDEEFVYILLQICRPQTLNDLLKRRKRITQFQIKYYIYQITQALKYVHAKKVIHRDLKLGNLFLTDQLQIKVGDFGLATKLTFDQERKKTTCGTPNYLAPEILINKNGHSYEVDIWSIGVITYALLFGRPPFETNDLKLTYSKIKTCNYSFPDTINVSSSSKKFITKILQLQPHKRPTLDEILEDQFISSIQIPKSLPLATISIPPSANFMKKYEKTSQNEVNTQINSFKNFCQQSNSNLNSYRTLQRNKIAMSTEKLGNRPENKQNMRIEELQGVQGNIKNKDQSENLYKDQTNYMKRAASTAGLMQRKKASSSTFKESGMPLMTNQPANLIIQKQHVPVRVIYFEENPKFGISYMLSTNAFGMRYNDSTCVITNAVISLLKYLVVQGSFKQISADIYPYSDTPLVLSKKAKIVNHYVKELKKRKTNQQQKMSNEMRIQLEKLRAKQHPYNSMKVYVVRSLKTSKAQFFEFNNDYVQVIFEDSSELLFKNITEASKKIQQKKTSQTVTYITKFSQLKQFSFTLLESQTQDIKKRMNYSLSVISRVKKSLDNKDVGSLASGNPSKFGQQNRQNRPPLGTATQSVNQSLQKQSIVGLGRSASTMRLGIGNMNTQQYTLSRQTSKQFSSTTRLTTVSKESEPSMTTRRSATNFALKQISNRIY